MFKRLFNFLGFNNNKKEESNTIKSEGRIAEEDPLLVNQEAEEYKQHQENTEQKALSQDKVSTRDNTHKRLTRKVKDSKMTKSLSDLETTIPDSFLERNHKPIFKVIESHKIGEEKSSKNVENRETEQANILYNKLISEIGVDTKLESDFIKQQVIDLLNSYNIIKGNITSYNDVQSKLIDSLKQGSYELLEGYVCDKNEVNNNISIEIMVAVLEASREKKISFEPRILAKWIDLKLNYFAESDSYLLDDQGIKTLQWIGKFLKASIQQFDATHDSSCLISGDYFFKTYMKLHNIVKESILTLVLFNIYNDKRIEKIKPSNLKLFLYEYLDLTTLRYLDDFSKGRVNLDIINLKDKSFIQAKKKANKILNEYIDKFQSYIHYHEGLITSANTFFNFQDFYVQQKERDAQKVNAKANKHIAKLKLKYGLDNPIKPDVKSDKDVPLDSTAQPNKEPFSKLQALFLERDTQPEKQISLKNYKRKERVESEEDEPSFEPLVKKQKAVSKILEKTISRKRKASTNQDDLNEPSTQERKENLEGSQKNGANISPIFNLVLSEDSEIDEDRDSAKPMSQLLDKDLNNSSLSEKPDKIVEEKAIMNISLARSPEGNQVFIDHLKSLLNAISAAAIEKNHTRIQEIAEQSKNILNNFKSDAGKYDEFLTNMPNHLNEMRLAILRGDFDKVHEIDNATRLALLCLDNEKNNYIHTATQSLAMPDEIIRAFKNNALTMQQNSLGDTPLHNVVRYRNDDVFFEIVNDKSLEPAWRITNNEGHTPIAIAIIDGNFDFVAKMISCTDSPIDHISDSGENLLHLVLKRGVDATVHKHVYDVEIVAKDLISAFKNKDLLGYLNQSDKEGNSPLKLAVEKNYLEVIEILVKAGVEKDLDLDEIPFDSSEKHPIKPHYLKSDCHLDKPEFIKVKGWLKQTVDILIDKYTDLRKEEGYLLLWITKILKFYAGVVGENQEVPEYKNTSNKIFYISLLKKINNLVKLEANEACLHKNFFSNAGNVDEEELFKQYEKIAKTGVVTLINKYIVRINSTRDQQNNLFNDLQRNYEKVFKESLKKFHQKKYKQGAEYEKQRSDEAGMKALKKIHGLYEKEANKPENPYVIVLKNSVSELKSFKADKPKSLPAQKNLSDLSTQLSLSNLTVVNSAPGDLYNFSTNQLSPNNNSNLNNEILSREIVSARRAGISDVSMLINSSPISNNDSNAGEVIRGNEARSDVTDHNLVGLYANIDAH
jgi:hypothetical protein